VLDFRIVHDGSLWVAENGSLAARGRTLEELDRELLSAIRKNRRIEDGEQLQIRMTFDGSSLPEWIRQYSSHYFNRVVTVTP
jgi:hypothetical protein